MSRTDYEDEKPWHRQPFDSDLGYALFSDYLVLELPRNLKALVRRPGGCPLSWGQLETLAHESGWRLRARAWDDHVAKLRETTIETAIEEDAKMVASRHIRLTKTMQRLAERQFNCIEKASAKSDAPDYVSTREAIHLARYGIQLERLAMGQATEAVASGPDLSMMSLEELRQAQELQAKAGIR